MLVKMIDGADSFETQATVRYRKRQGWVGEIADDI